MQMNINLHVSEVNAAIAVFSGIAEKIRDQAIAQSQPAPVEPPAPPAPPVEPPAPVVRAVKKVVKRK